MSELSFPFPSAPASNGALQEIVPGVLWLRMPLPLALDHINLYLLQDDDGWLIVDTGIGDQATRQLWQQIFAGPLAGQRISGVLCTHYHYDHAGLAGWLCDTLRVPLYMSYGEYFTLRTLAVTPPATLPWQHLEYFQRCGFPSTALDDIHQVLRMSSQLVTAPPAAFRRLRHGEVLKVGGHDWQLHLGEGHTAEQMLLYDAERGLLIAGDQLLPRITANISVLPGEAESDLLKDWLASLKRLARLANAADAHGGSGSANPLILPAHELPYRGLQLRVQQLEQHHGRQLDILQQLCATTAENADELSAFEASRQLFAHRRNLSNVDQMMALGECLAHLNHLLRRGEIERRLDDDGCWRYRPRGA